MPFTDEVLKNVKEHCMEFGSNVNRLTVLDLIDRLEAAEKAAQFMYISAHPIDDASEEAYQEWKRSTGK